MAGLVTGWVLKYSTVKDPRELLVLIVLADCAHDDGTSAFPAVDTIAERARCSPRKVQYALRSLEAEGHIKRQGTTQKGTSIWQVEMNRADNFHAANWGNGALPNSGDAQRAPLRAPLHARAPDPSIEPSEEPSFTGEDGSSNAGVGGAQPTAEQAVTWKRIRGRLADELPEIRFHSFIEPLELVGLDGDRLTVAAPAHVLTSVRERYLSTLVAAARAELGGKATVEVCPARTLREVS